MVLWDVYRKFPAIQPNLMMRVPFGKWFLKFHNTRLFENELHESKLLNLFDVNEDENDISEYHGDLDPDKCYYNQFSHKLITITLWEIFQQIFKSPSHVT